MTVCGMDGQMMTEVAEQAVPAVREHMAKAEPDALAQTARQLLVLGRRMGRIAMRLAAARADELDLTMPQHQALRALRHRSCRMSDLGGRLMVSKQWASQSVDSLVRAGLATRQEDPDDRRHAVVSATPQGLERLESHEQALATFLAGALEGMPADALERLDEALAEVNAHLARRRDEGYFRSLRQAGKRESGDKA